VVFSTLFSVIGNMAKHTGRNAPLAFCELICFHHFLVLGIFDPGNYEIHLPDIDLGYVSFSDVSPLRVGFTLCFWLKTEHSGFFIEYKVASEQNETLVLGVYCHNDTLVLKLKKTRR